MKDFDKKDYVTSLLIETVRYAELERDDLDDSEYGEMIRSVWTLLNPVDSPGRMSSVRGSVTNDDGGAMNFSAHSHHREPLSESYDDMLVFHSMMNGEDGSAHYIVDRFCPKKII